MKKVILLGIDGATPDLIKEWIKENKLPNFQKLQENGTWGKLKSTIPPFSAPAWTSIVTGCSPGKHGIYGFETSGTLKPTLINSQYRKTPAIWNYLSDINLKNIIINVPGSYPPVKINGVMITGLLTPSKDSNFTYPKNIRDRLTKNDLGEYQLEQFWLEDFTRSRMKKNSPDLLLQNINNQMSSRIDIALKLMNENNYDFTMIVLRGTDTAQHFLFDNKKLLLSCYQKVDLLIEKIIKNHPEACIFIVSDHGFEEIKKILYPDNMLYNKGYLTPKQDPYSSPISQFFIFINRVFTKILRLLPKKTLKESKILKNILFKSSSKSNLIDFSKTIAFATADGRGIQICSKKRFTEGIVEINEYEQIRNKIKTDLLEIKDPQTGEKIIEKIYNYEEVYGEDAIDSPDIVFDLKKGITAAEWIKFPDKIGDIINSKKRNIPYIFKKDSAGRTGDHSPYGIFYAYGDNIKSDYEIKNISVQDVLPTIFTYMGFTKPIKVDGISKDEIFILKPKIKDIWELQITKKPQLKKSELSIINKLKKQLK